MLKLIVFEWIINAIQAHHSFWCINLTTFKVAIETKYCFWEKTQKSFELKVESDLHCFTNKRGYEIKVWLPKSFSLKFRKLKFHIEVLKFDIEGGIRHKLLTGLRDSTSVKV